MTYCDVCHSRIRTYTEFKIEKRTERGINYKTVCYHCKIKDLENKLEAIRAYLVALLDSTEDFPNWAKHERDVAQYVLNMIQEGES